MKSVVATLFILWICVSANDEEFDYFSGGSDWHGACGIGTKQSPIHLINTTYAETFPELQINYTSIFNPDVGFSNDIKDFYMKGNFGNMTATTPEGDGPFCFKSRQTNFHAPAEHTIDGEHYELEMQIVHSLDDSHEYPVNFAILSVLFNFFY